MAIGSSSAIVGPTQVALVSIPPLEPGDRLSRAEFERRYDAMPGLKNAELIEGVVYMPSPVRFAHHGHPHSRLIVWLGLYETHTHGVATADNATVRLDAKNVFQPDALLMIQSSSGGQARIDQDDYVAGAPELVAEVASSSVSIDLHDKLEVYRRNGVREYLIWRVLDRAIDWFALRDGQYQPLAADNDGVARSNVFPGLWLHIPAMLDGKYEIVQATLQRGLATTEHQQFVANLKQADKRLAQ
jgi:Uma2 family endonuclease